MSIFTTPLQFGYFTAWLYAFLFWYRGYREERQADMLMGFIMFFLGMEIQDYTFGFAGINVLWEEFNGFPRYFHLAFAPTIYFYIRSQTNRDFKLDRQCTWHYLPYALYFVFNLVIFFMGKNAVDAVEKFRYDWHLNFVEYLLVWVSYGIYFFMTLKLYQAYSQWIENYYSDTEAINLKWLRNFIYLIIAGEVFRLLWYCIDLIMDDLPFEQDWWWHLFTVGIIIYIAIQAYYQHQYPRHGFLLTVQDKVIPGSEENKAKADFLDNPEWQGLKNKIIDLFEKDQIYLDPNLSLSDVAQRLKTNTSILSAAINQGFDKNFNDYVNQYRIDEFLRQSSDAKNSHLTLLAIALDSGFNSKSTFNRAFKKLMGKAPSEYVENLK